MALADALESQMGEGAGVAPIPHHMVMYGGVLDFARDAQLADAMVSKVPCLRAPERWVCLGWHKV